MKKIDKVSDTIGEVLVDWRKVQIENSVTCLITDSIVSVKEYGEQKAFDMAAESFKTLRSRYRKENP